MASSAGSNKVIYAALAGNAGIAITKYIAAMMSGSSAMLSEAIHSTVDTGNELLMLYGVKRSRRPADGDQPLGHARELYFWSFIVALMVFALGALVSLWEGYNHLRNPEPATDLWLNYLVLAIAACFEGYSWNVARRELAREKGDMTYLQAATQSKDPTTFTVLFEDSAALLGLLIAFVAVTLSHVLEMPWIDGLGSVGIGLVLAGTAAYLARESKALLIGEPALPEVEKKVRALTQSQPEVAELIGLQTLQLSPDAIVVMMNVAFDDALAVPRIERAVGEIDSRIREEIPEVQLVMIKPRGEAVAKGARPGPMARTRLEPPAPR